MNTLTAVNRMLRHCGHPSVNDLDGSNQSAAQAQETLAAVSKRVLGNGHSFNTSKIDLAVDGNGRVPVARGYLKIRFPRNELSVRPDGSTLYVWNDRERDWHGKPIDNVEVVFDYDDFSAIPEPFAEWISWEATAELFAELKQGVSQYAIHQRNRYQAKAFNSSPPRSIHDASGYSDSHLHRPWIHIG